MILRVISGGQTGADQAGLAAARAVGLPTGGWVPQGCRTESGPMSELVTLYGCQETTTDAWAERTVKNAQWAHVTLWFGRSGSPGYNLTRKSVLAAEREWKFQPELAELRMLKQLQIPFIVNVAGNRESKNPGIYQKTYDLLLEAWK